MRKGALALALSLLVLLLTFASHGVWCAAAATSAMAEGAAQPHLRPHHHETQGKRLMEMQTPRKFGRMSGSAGGTGGGGRAAGGGTTDARPHNSKNGGAVTLPAPSTSALALVFTSAVLLSTLSF